jgi:hypothetical protein
MELEQFLLSNHLFPISNLRLKSAFPNDGVEEIEKLLKPVWEKISKRVIKAGYGFANSPGGFIENLSYRYAVHLENEREKECKKNHTPFYPSKIYDVIAALPSLDETIISDLKGQYYRLRLVNDTQRAIYRLIQVGIIEDYSMDYAKEITVVHFSSKEEKTYSKALQVYLRRYLGRNSVLRLVEKYDDQELDNFIKPLKIITDFSRTR